MLFSAHPNIHYRTNFTKKERDLFFYPSTVNFLPQSAADRSSD